MKNMGQKTGQETGQKKGVSAVVPGDADYAGKTLLELYWGRGQNVFIIKIERKTESILVPGGNTHIFAGDHVFAVGVAKALDRFRDYQNVGAKYSFGSLKDFLGYGDTEKQSPLSCIEYQVLLDTGFGDRPYPSVIQKYGGEILLVGISYNKKSPDGKRKHSCIIGKISDGIRVCHTTN